MSQPAPGWYPDPAGSSRLRWWNGRAWTEQFQPLPTHQPSPQLASRAAPPVPAPTSGAMPGPHLPAYRQAPAVTSDPYQAPGSTPIFGEVDESAVSPGLAATTSASSTSRWRVAAFLSWVAVFALVISSLVAGSFFRMASTHLRNAESDLRDARSDLHRAQSALEEAQRNLKEAQQ